MATTFEKLNLKGRNEILVLNAPGSFEPEIAKLKGITVNRNLADVREVCFMLAFVTKQEEISNLARILSTKAEGDALLWFAYPKGTSKRYKCEFNRDNGWASLRAVGFDSVRQIAIDEDWSALRFRRSAFIKVSNKASTTKRSSPT